MGLDAVVYKKASPDAESLPAIVKRLGNASMIAWLANEILSFNPKGSILIENVLYSGSHSGDAISLELLDTLQDEVDRISLEADKRKIEELRTFLQDMTELIQAAKEQQTPIIFV